MRVAMVGAFPLHPIGFKGGVEASTWNLIEGLATFSDMEIHLVTTNGALRKGVQVERDGVTYHYLPSWDHLATSTLYMRSRLLIRRKLSEINPDVVHGQDTMHHGYICLKMPYPVVLSNHGIEREEAILRTWAQRPTSSYLERLSSSTILYYDTHLTYPTNPIS